MSIVKRLARVAAFYAAFSIVLNIAFVIYIGTPPGHRFLRYEIAKLVAYHPEMRVAVQPLVAILREPKTETASR